MSLEQAAAAVAVAAIVMYTVFGGADFGGGIWTLLAWGPRRTEQREALEQAIGPVWETNHVWLILLVVTLFAAFPAGYAAIFTALYVPLFVALVGVVARGAAFALRHYGERGSRMSHGALRVFSVASVITPFTFGLVIGGVSGGHVDVRGGDVVSGAWAGWLRPFALTCGVIGVSACAFLAAAYMASRTDGALRRDFRVRAIASSLVLGAATTVALPVAHLDAAQFAAHLTRPSVLVAMAATAVLGVAALLVLWRGTVRLAPPLAALTVAAMIGGWALAQDPYLVAPGLTMSDGAASGATLRAFLYALPAGVAVLAPSLLLLYGTFSREERGGARKAVEGGVDSCASKPEAVE
jgi:cytochrome bd ubiquinol oxidase subunit II